MISAVPCPVKVAAEHFPHSIALCDAETVLTYAELDARVAAATRAFDAGEIPFGRPIAILARNSIDYAVLFFAALRQGHPVVLLNHRLTPREWEAQLKMTDCRLLVAASDLLTMTEGIGIARVALHEFVIAQQSINLQEFSGEIPTDREAVIIFSSGSTDTPHGVVLSWGNLYYSALGTNMALASAPDNGWLAALPFFHVGGLAILIRSALTGSAAYIMREFDGPKAIEAIEKGRINLVSIVPTMLQAMMACDTNNRLKGAKAIIVGGASFDKPLRQEAARRGLPIRTTYGLTETASMVTLLDRSDDPGLWHTSGQVLPYREVMIASGDNRPLPRGAEGRIMVRGEVVSGRQLDRDESAQDSDGWFKTDDVGHLDDNGYLVVSGREGKRIKSGGEYIDLTRLEQALLSLRGITQAVVLARPDDTWGERPVAFVVVGKDGPDAETIRETLSAVLPRPMIPDRVIIVPDLPLVGSGKYDLRELRHRYPEIFRPDLYDS